MKRSKLVFLIGVCLLTTLASWSADSLSESTIDGATSFAEAEYQVLKTEADNNAKILFIEHLLKRPTHSWFFSLNRAFEDQKITPNDLLFIVQGTDFTKPIENNSLFSLAILNRLKHQKKIETMVGLLSLPAIDMKLKYLGPDLKVNLLIALLEKGHIAAFETIIAACPDFDFNPFGKNAVLATSQIDDPDNLGTFYNGKKPETIEYSVASWLMRENQSQLIGYYAKPDYIKAAQALLLFAQKRLSIEMSPADIGSLAQFCNKNEILPKNFDYVGFAQLKGIKEEVIEQEAKPTEDVKKILPEQAETNDGTKAPNNSPSDPEVELKDLEEKAEPFFQPLFKGLSDLLSFSKS